MTILKVVFAKGIDKDLVVLMAARASRLENQDAIDGAIVNMLSNLKEYKSLSQREEINDLIEKAILEAEDRGPKVMSFGLMNQRDELNQYGELYRKNNLKLRIKLVDGTSLAAAIVLNTLPLGTKETFLVGKLSKLSYVLALALCQKSIQVLVPRREVYETLKLKFPQELQDYVVFSKDYSCEDFA